MKKVIGCIILFLMCGCGSNSKQLQTGDIGYIVKPTYACHKTEDITYEEIYKKDENEKLINVYTKNLWFFNIDDIIIIEDTGPGSLKIRDLDSEFSFWVLNVYVEKL